MSSPQHMPLRTHRQTTAFASERQRRVRLFLVGHARRARWHGLRPSEASGTRNVPDDTFAHHERGSIAIERFMAAGAVPGQFEI
jgi:hypothetical protein